MTWTQSQSIACNWVHCSWVVHIYWRSDAIGSQCCTQWTTKATLDDPLGLYMSNMDFTWVLRILPVIEFSNIVVTFLLVVTECQLTGMVHLYLRGGDKSWPFNTDGGQRETNKHRLTHSSSTDNWRWSVSLSCQKAGGANWWVRTEPKTL